MDMQENHRHGSIVISDLDETDFGVLRVFLVCILVTYPRESQLQ